MAPRVCLRRKLPSAARAGGGIQVLRCGLQVFQLDSQWPGYISTSWRCFKWIDKRSCSPKPKILFECVSFQFKPCFLLRISYIFRRGIKISMCEHVTDLLDLVVNNDSQLVSISTKVLNSWKFRNMLFPQQQVKSKTKGISIDFNRAQKFCSLFLGVILLFFPIQHLILSF